MRHDLDIGLLPGLNRRARGALYAAGISTINQIAALEPDDLRRFKGIKTTAEAICASARAFVAGAPVWYNPLPAVCHASGYMFDLETNPATGIPWCLGWSDGCGEVHIALVAPGCERQGLALCDGRSITLVPRHDDAWRVFHAAVCEGGAPIYHWTGFDASIMRVTAPPEVKASLLNRMHDLHRSFTRSVKLPVGSTSLKVVARYFAFDWAESDYWQEAYFAYLHWLRSGDLRLLTKACAYQRDDVLALGVVWKWLVENRPAEG